MDIARFYCTGCSRKEGGKIGRRRRRNLVFSLSPLTFFGKQTKHCVEGGGGEGGKEIFVTTCTHTHTISPHNL